MEPVAPHEGGKRFDWGIVALIAIMLLLFAVRMSIVTSTPYLSYDSYLTVRSVEHIHQTGVPLRSDPLSVTGETRVSNPLYQYVLALFTFLSPLAYKVLPNLLMVLVLIPVYIIAKRLSKSSVVAAIAALLAGTGPVLFARSMNTTNSMPLALLLMLIIVALLSDVEKHIFPLIFCSIALAFTHPLIFVLAFAFLILMGLLRVEGYGVDDRMGELFFFTLLLAMWFYVLVYKRALFEFGISTLWQNVPHEYVSATIGSVSLLAILYGLGIVTFLFGTFGIYHALFENPDREAYIVIAPIFAAIALLVLRLLPLALGITILTPLLAIMAAYGIGVSGMYIARTKMAWTAYPLTILLIVFFVFSAIIPALANANNELKDTPDANQVNGYKAVGSMIGSDAVLLTTLREAAAVQYFSRHKTVADDDFLLVHNPDELVNDVDGVYTARFSIAAASAAAKLGFTHVLFSPAAAAQYRRAGLLIDESTCITSTTVGSGTILYTFACKEAKA